MTASKVIAGLLNPKNSNFIHVSAAGYFFLLTFSVLYACIFIAYPIIYREDEAQRFRNIIFILFVFFNIMGNYFLGLKYKSYFKSGLILMDPPRSWKFCDICQQHSPPRSHHCSVCNVCVLKQDHHCFFLCQCIGLRNQKFFIIFGLYVAIGSFFAIHVLLKYLSMTYVSIQFTCYNISSYFFPMLVYNWLWTEISVTWMTVFCIAVFYGSLSTGFGCSFLFLSQCFLVYRGQTLYEFMNSKPSHVSLQNFSQVFGNYWFLHLLLPLPLKSLEEKSPWGYPVYFKSV